MKLKIGDIKRLPMVSWFNIKQLAHTAFESIVSKIIGGQADRRLLIALAANDKEFYDYTLQNQIVNGLVEPVENTERSEIWLDYIADTGDGWNPTYSVAYYASKLELELKHGREKYDTKRGSVLVFGGDEVYPTPSAKDYKERLIIPYTQAFGDDKPAETPHVFAIPGNHDWYDGLEAFTRLFCSDLGSRKFAGWYSRQKRSYFALKLPGGWWILASDGQLHSNIDTSQLEYFRTIAGNHMKDGDKVIMCIAEPVWIYAHKYKQYGAPYDESDLIYLQEEILAPNNVEVKVILSGDLHHYRRHEEITEEAHAKAQKITAGGGGAFLHPTHGFDFSVITEAKELPGQQPRQFKLKKSYPDEKTSKRLGWRNVLFPLLNPGFGLLTGLMYFITIWIVSSTFKFDFPHNVMGFIAQTSKSFVLNPVAALWLGMLGAGFVFFTDTHSKFYKWIGGLSHYFLHLFSIFYIGLFAAYINNAIFKENIYTGFIFIPIIVFALGWIIGSFNMGLYLTISMNIFGRHDNEAFSALKIQDYKNFLRLHIDKEGTLTIYPIKIEKSSRRWRKREEGEEDNSFIVPRAGTKPELIEEPIVLKK